MTGTEEQSHVSKKERDVAAGLGSELGTIQERMF